MAGVLYFIETVFEDLSWICGRLGPCRVLSYNMLKKNGGFRVQQIKISNNKSQISNGSTSSPPP
jgi:hypothetical protein